MLILVAQTRGLPSQVKGAALRRLSRRSSRVRIPLPAPFQCLLSYFFWFVVSLLICCFAVSAYFLSNSKPTKFTPSRIQATAVFPMPMKGSKTSLVFSTPCSLMHIIGSLGGNVEGWGRCFFRDQIVSYGINHVSPRSRRSLVAFFQRFMFVLSW